MNSPHTPGPWHQTGVNVRAFGDDGALVAVATNYWANAETPESERLANARLISCAPEMLEALEIILNSTCGDVGDDGYEGCIRIESKALDRARSIISKAKGNL